MHPNPHHHNHTNRQSLRSYHTVWISLFAPQLSVLWTERRTSAQVDRGSRLTKTLPLISVLFWTRILLHAPSSDEVITGGLDERPSRIASRRTERLKKKLWVFALRFVGSAFEWNSNRHRLWPLATTKNIENGFPMWVCVRACIASELSRQREQKQVTKDTHTRILCWCMQFASYTPTDTAKIVSESNAVRQFNWSPTSDFHFTSSRTMCVHSYCTLRFCAIFWADIFGASYSGSDLLIHTACAVLTFSAAAAVAAFRFHSLIFVRSLLVLRRWVEFCSLFCLSGTGCLQQSRCNRLKIATATETSKRTLGP